MLYFIIIIINAIFAVLFKKGKWIAGLSFLYLGALSGQSDLINNRDTMNYYFDYVHIGSVGYTSRFEWLYVELEKIGHVFNLDYGTFRVIVMIAAYLLFFWMLSILVDNVSLFYVVFSIFSFPLEATQIRTFLMFVLVLTAIALLKVNFKGSQLLAMVAAILAPGFHSIGYFFTIAVFLTIFLTAKYESLLIKWLPKVSIVGTIVILIPGLSGRVGILLSRVFGTISSNQTAAENVAVRFNDSSTLFTIALATVYFLIYFTLKKSFWVDSTKIVVNNTKSKLLNFDFITAFLTFSVPFLGISGQYQRILRYGVLLMVLEWIALFEKRKTINYIRSKGELPSILFFLLILSSMILFYGLYGNGSPFIKTIPYIINFNTGYSG
ncbi:EpsG family protein [Furfurilactobacillus siliginis]|uniref:EpsG family protein n=1 Tax=Furfurilactobacillus siliginis TaxID=348151 RepID=A0A0R2L414_9LACO|nr:EpsG family protein [Furfurilactobacillus siliginis]KRN96553.1 hypothetical protein IV55_GL001070 [Furfurilactobacillus siliginis]GEK29040.1 hypothetical protein LSI01_13510 [Furfurilactobacillus siliginis]